MVEHIVGGEVIVVVQIFGLDRTVSVQVFPCVQNTIMVDIFGVDNTIASPASDVIKIAVSGIRQIFISGAAPKVVVIGVILVSPETANGEFMLCRQVVGQFTTIAVASGVFVREISVGVVIFKSAEESHPQSRQEFLGEGNWSAQGELQIL